MLFDVIILIKRIIKISYFLNLSSNLIGKLTLFNVSINELLSKNSLLLI